MTFEINPNIFRAYDVRGLAPEELNTESAELIGIAFGNYLEKIADLGLNPKTKKVLVSRDHRRTGKDIKRGLIKGLMKTGLHVVDIGVASTPEFYFGICKHRYNAGCQITASHNPKEYNGIKFQLAKALALSGEKGIYEMRDNILKGMLDVKHIDVVLKAEHIRFDLKEEYINYIVHKCRLQRKLNIVIDTGNGVLGKVPEKIFKRLGCKVKTLYAKPDDTFPNHPADPHLYDSLRALQKEVKKQKADIGIAFDGDGDRIGIVDEKGRIVETGKLLMMLARKALAKKKGTVVYEVRVSRGLIEDTKAHGGKVIITRAGHSYILDKIIEKESVFGGELSGHIYYPLENYPYDDGVFSAIKVAEIVSGLESLADYVDDMPWYHPSPEIYINSTDEKKFEQVKKFVKVLRKKGYKVSTIDGARIEFKNGWALVRASNTAPKIKCRFEGETKSDLKDIMAKMKTLMKKANI